ncbi:hypothetical protein HLY00_1468 [Mycolicibacterium hippocampi]|uniref:Uncharacterized protein n=2 Tax=Mycobacteriaceae TaxID=1762 RepID=A0A850PIQ6_9MYCO|nr:hypothetical protein [Mycolicibacterium hippocampi]
MLPSRSRLTSWNPDTLSSTGPAVTSAGKTVERSVDGINANLEAMDETRSWEGPAHTAASKMFNRGHTHATEFGDYTAAIGKALCDGATSLGATRTALLNKADEIDSGELQVTDQWVVLIKPAAMSAEKVATLMEKVAAEQVVVNDLLLAVGDADDAAAERLTAAAQPSGFVAPNADGLGGMMLPGFDKPADEVPNPRDPLGLVQQSVMRGEDMATTVRDTKEEIVNGDEFRKTLIMQDGSKHVIWEYGPPEYPTVSHMHYDTDGDVISSTMSWTTFEGIHNTEIEWADGTIFKATETPDGVRAAGFTLPDGRHGVLPPDNPFFTGPVPATISSALTGLDAHVGRGGRLPMVSMDAAETIGKGAKFGGPAVSILSSIYSVAAAETPYDRCVTGFAGSFGVVGEVGGAAGGGAIAGAVFPFPPVQAVMVPAGAIGGSMAIGGWMESLGAKVGERFCQ